MRTLANFYDAKSITQFNDSATKLSDSLGGMILKRDLEAVDPTIFEKKYPGLALLESGIVVSNIGGFKRKIVSLRRDPRGGYETAYDGDNGGVISQQYDDSDIKVTPRLARSTYTESQLRTLGEDGINILQDYVSSHDEVYKNEIDRIGLLGVDAKKGLLNNTVYQSEGAAQVISNTSSADQDYSVIAKFLNNQYDGVSNTDEYQAKVMIMPVKVMNQLRTKERNTAAGTIFVLDALKAAFPDVTFMSSSKATTQAVAFSTYEGALQLRIPVPFTMTDVVKVGAVNYEFATFHHIGGADILHPTSGRILTGVATA